MATAHAWPFPAGTGVALVDNWVEHWVSMEDLVPEDATDEETTSIETLRARLLELRGLSAVPVDWTRHFYLRGALLRFLRGREGEVEAAAKMVHECVEWYASFEFAGKAREYEASVLSGQHAGREAMFQRYLPVALYGKDRRGAGVLYIRWCKTDYAGLMREAGYEFYLKRELFRYGWFWWTLYHESLLARTWLMGRVIVADLAGASWRRAISSMGVNKRMGPVMLDHFPEGARAVFITNCPWYVASGYALFRPLLPARTQTKLRFFRDSDGDGMRKELGVLVELGQLPKWLGGGGEPGPWTAGDGGEVPVGLISDGDEFSQKD